MEKENTLSRMILCLFISLCVLTIVLIFLDKDNKNSDSITEKLSDYSEGWIIEYGSYASDVIKLPASLNNDSDTVTMTKKLDYIDGNNSAIEFYSHHQIVRVLIDNREIYSFGDVGTNLFGKTPGNKYNVVPLEKDYEGHTIKIELKGVYKSVTGDCPKISMGSVSDCVLGTVNNELWRIVISVLFILQGIIMVLIHYWLNKYITFDKSFLYLGFFICIMGVWALSETALVNFSVDNLALVSFVTHSCLFLSIVPMLMFWRERLDKRFENGFNAMSIISMLAYVVCMILHIAAVLDMNEALTVVHILYSVSIAMVIGVMVLSKNTIKTKGGKKIIYGILLVFVGALIDIYQYYTTNMAYNSTYVMFAILIYSYIPISALLKDVLDKVNLGRQVGNYRRIAYTDALTGVGNRAAFNTEIESIPQSDYYKYSIVNFDVNDLKRTNDKFGHECGDSLIITAARAILNTFEPYGTCYRTGGDEFVAVLYKVDEKTYDKLMAKMRAYLDGVKLHDKVGIKIASGYAEYMYDTDVDLYSTMNRADEKMYEYKRMMKSGMIQDQKEEKTPAAPSVEAGNNGVSIDGDDFKEFFDNMNKQ